MVYALLIMAVFWMAYSNGANDNFKGIATIYGSGTLSYRSALGWATLATVAGSLVSIFLAGSLLKAFSGKGLVPDGLVGDPKLLLAVGAAAAITILLATFLGMPTSTTHALTGGLLGVGLLLAGSNLAIGRLWGGFMLPLLISPILAILGTALVYPVFHWGRQAMGVTRETCVCAGTPPVQLAGTSPDRAAVSLHTPATLTVDKDVICVERYQGKCIGINAQSAVDAVHIASGGAVCFARALNDTPKIAALLMIAGAPLASWKLGLVATAMAAGGVLNAKRVAETMSRRITDLNPGQGLTANLVTAGLVMGASHLGVPVSTTHVSCGSIFGISTVRGQGRWKTIAQILTTWITTLPFAAVLAALLFWLSGG